MERSKDSLRPLEGEFEKTPEELHIIEVANDLLRMELDSLGIPNYRSIEPARVHMLTGDVYTKHFPHLASAWGHVTSSTDMIVVNKEFAASPLIQFAVTLHEMIHRASTMRFYEPKNGRITTARSGYKINSPWKETLGYDELAGFNETIVEYTEKKIVANESNTLQREFGVSNDALQRIPYPYAIYAPLLHTISRGIAANKEIPIQRVLDTLERGQFQKTILALKDLEPAFGKGALRVLACLGALSDPSARTHIDNMVSQYFDTENENDRFDTMARIREVFEKYLKRQVVKAAPANR